MELPQAAAAPLQEPVTIGDLIREVKLLEVNCGNCRPERHLYLNPNILRLPKRMPVPKVWGSMGVPMTPSLVCSRPFGPLPAERIHRLSLSILPHWCGPERHSHQRPRSLAHRTNIFDATG
jgi:hypothetical protein